MSFTKQFEKVTLHSFDYSACNVPDAIAYPNHYEPELIAKKAAEHLQNYLTKHSELHDFESKESKDGGGKMFGVLVVQDQNRNLFYLAGFSGNLGGETIVPGFVPPIYDLKNKKNFFVKEEEKITLLNQQYETLLRSEEYVCLKKNLKKNEFKKEKEIYEYKQQIAINKRKRLEQRNITNNPTVIAKLNHQSALEKIELKKLKQKWKSKIREHELALYRFEQKIKEIEDQRKSMSTQLQKRIFESYKLKNALGEKMDLIEVFRKVNAFPPAAAGECAAPKLFQYAYDYSLKPIALAEFWWGNEQTNKIRKHKNFYPACKSKCEPILSFMLKGLKVEANPLSQKKTLPKIEVLFEDEFLIAIDKPSGLLSVPGKTKSPSVINWINKNYPNFNDMKPIHRLDQGTSGVLLIAKNQSVYKHLQRQFLTREVKKEYIAILEGIPEVNKGVITLPLRPDVEDRPRQMVCKKHGKPAITHFEVIETTSNKTKILFKPLTGRTHQLRVHASHYLGLNTPIVGDSLYGNKANRLMLHAKKIEFAHPVSNVKIVIESKKELTI